MLLQMKYPSQPIPSQSRYLSCILHLTPAYAWLETVSAAIPMHQVHRPLRRCRACRCSGVPPASLPQPAGAPAQLARPRACRAGLCYVILDVTLYLIYSARPTRPARPGPPGQPGQPGQLGQPGGEAPPSRSEGPPVCCQPAGPRGWSRKQSAPAAARRIIAAPRRGGLRSVPSTQKLPSLRPCPWPSSFRECDFQECGDPSAPGRSCQGESWQRNWPWLASLKPAGQPVVRSRHGFSNAVDREQPSVLHFAPSQAFEPVESPLVGQKEGRGRRKEGEKETEGRQGEGELERAVEGASIWIFGAVQPACVPNPRRPQALALRTVQPPVCDVFNNNDENSCMTQACSSLVHELCNMSLYYMKLKCNAVHGKAIAVTQTQPVLTLRFPMLTTYRYSSKGHPGIVEFAIS